MKYFNQIRPLPNKSSSSFLIGLITTLKEQPGN